MKNPITAAIQRALDWCHGTGPYQNGEDRLGALAEEVAPARHDALPLVDALTAQRDACVAALEAVLLFYSASHWTADKKQQWEDRMNILLGDSVTRHPKVVGSNGDGTWDGARATNEATTKNLCNGVRAALALCGRKG